MANYDREEVALKQAQQAFQVQRERLKRAANQKIEQTKQVGQSLNVSHHIQNTPLLATGAFVGVGLVASFLTRPKRVTLSSRQIDLLSKEVARRVQPKIESASSPPHRSTLTHAMGRALFNPTILMTLGNLALGMIQSRTISDAAEEQQRHRLP